MGGRRNASSTMDLLAVYSGYSWGISRVRSRVDLEVASGGLLGAGDEAGVVAGAFPGVVRSEVAEFFEQDAQDAGVGDDGDVGRCGGVAEGGQLFKDTMFEEGYGFASRGWEGRELGDPAGSVGLVALLDLLPGEGFPIAEVDLAEGGAGVERKGLGRGDGGGRLGSAEKIAGIDGGEGVGREPVEERGKLALAAVVERRVGVPAEGSDEGGFSVTDEEERRGHEGDGTDRGTWEEALARAVSGTSLSDEYKTP